MASRKLKVSDNRRFLVYDDGTPFFYLADTAWELFHRLNREEADLYLRDRADKGFTVIQAVVLAELDGLRARNAYGHLPLQDFNPAQPDEKYFEHVDWIVDRAQELGLVLGMLPTWGDKWNQGHNLAYGGPEIFTPHNAEIYGQWLGRRYRDKPIIWILGGDRRIETEAHRDILNAMAAGLQAGDGGQHLKTLHPCGGASSSQWFHEAPWLDFNMWQSGHTNRDWSATEPLALDYEKTSVKPCLNGEPCYEDHGLMSPQWQPTGTFFEEIDIRRAAYWALFAGACGHTYGCHPVWQMWDEGREPINGPRRPWHEALALPAAGQMRHARTLLESRSPLTRIPDQTLIVADDGPAHFPAMATRDEESRYAFIYLPCGQNIEVEFLPAGVERVRASWFDPRQGDVQEAEDFPAGRHSFTPPNELDWVLLLDTCA